MKILQQIQQMQDLTSNPEIVRRRNVEVSGWSVGQQIDHMVQVNNMILEKLEEIATTKTGERGRPAWKWYVLNLLGKIPRGKGKAPESVLPKEVEPEDLARQVEEMDKRLRAFVPQVDAVDRLGFSFRHPIFGALTAKQWMRFLEIHTGHHLAIVKDILG